MGETRSFAAGNASGVRSHDAHLEEIVRKYGRLIRHAIRKAGGDQVPVLADDIEQTVIVNLWQQIAREQIIDHPASYLYKAAIRETVRAVRRERERAGATVTAMPNGGLEPADPESLAVARQRGQAVAAALAELAPDRARAVRAHLRGWSVQEIMQATGWTYQRARNLVARGMSDLRSALTARGVR